MTLGHDICFLELDEYLKQIKVRIPYHVIRGRDAGPTLYVQACQHGTELHGWEVVGRVFDWATLAVLEEVVSPVDGFLFLDRPWGGNRNRSLVEPGTEVALIRDVPRVLTPADGPEPGSWKTQGTRR